MSEDEKKLTREEARGRVREAARTGRLCYQCCFCHGTIDGDITAVILVTKWNGPEDDQRSQQWFCHAACFTEKTGERIDVLGTVDEVMDRLEESLKGDDHGPV